MANQIRTYFSDIYQMMRSIFIGMGITLRYFFRSYKKREPGKLRDPSGVITVWYPQEMDSIPVRHRGIHYLETDRCIMCHKCAMACPVDCIEIEGTRETGVEGTIEGSKGAMISKFTVDYGRCIFCHLCIEPCPEVCIHMGKEFDFSGYTRADMVKNLLTDDIFDYKDAEVLEAARVEIARKEAETKAAKAAARKKKS